MLVALWLGLPAAAQAQCTNLESRRSFNLLTSGTAPAPLVEELCGEVFALAPRSGAAEDPPPRRWLRRALCAQFAWQAGQAERAQRILVEQPFNDQALRLGLEALARCAGISDGPGLRDGIIGTLAQIRAKLNEKYPALASSPPPPAPPPSPPPLALPAVSTPPPGIALSPPRAERTPKPRCGRGCIIGLSVGVVLVGGAVGIGVGLTRPPEPLTFDLRTQR